MERTIQFEIDCNGFWNEEMTQLRNVIRLIQTKKLPIVSKSTWLQRFKCFPIEFNRSPIGSLFRTLSIDLKYLFLIFSILASENKNSYPLFGFSSSYCSISLSCISNLIFCFMKTACHNHCTYCYFKLCEYSLPDRFIIQWFKE